MHGTCQELNIIVFRPCMSTRYKPSSCVQAQLAETWSSLATQHRVLIHVPSQTLLAVAAEAGTRCGDHGPGRSLASSSHAGNQLALLELAQLGRLCDVADPLVDVIFVVPAPLPQSVEAYWTKMLEVLLLLCCIAASLLRCFAASLAMAIWSVLDARSACRLVASVMLQRASVLCTPRISHAYQPACRSLQSCCQAPAHWHASAPACAAAQPSLCQGLLAMQRWS